jgi:hypothetical protein
MAQFGLFLSYFGVRIVLSVRRESKVPSLFDSFVLTNLYACICCLSSWLSQKEVFSYCFQLCAKELSPPIILSVADFVQLCTKLVTLIMDWRK